MKNRTFFVGFCVILFVYKENERLLPVLRSDSRVFERGFS
jgi:hypothetical protein